MDTLPNIQTQFITFIIFQVRAVICQNDPDLEISAVQSVYIVSILVKLQLSSSLSLFLWDSVKQVDTSFIINTFFCLYIFT